jgi:hypothetical protein
VNAQVTYAVARIRHPWPTKGQEVTDAWCLLQRVWIGDDVLANEKPVAIFNLDSEARTFMDWLARGGQVRVG